MQNKAIRYEKFLGLNTDLESNKLNNAISNFESQNIRINRGIIEKRRGFAFVHDIKSRYEQWDVDYEAISYLPDNPLTIPIWTVDTSPTGTPIISGGVLHMRESAGIGGQYQYYQSTVGKDPTKGLSCEFSFKDLDGAAGNYFLVNLGDTNNYATVRIGLDGAKLVINVQYDLINSVTWETTDPLVINEYNKYNIIYQGNRLQVYFNNLKVIDRAVITSITTSYKTRVFFMWAYSNTISDWNSYLQYFKWTNDKMYSIATESFVKNMFEYTTSRGLRQLLIHIDNCILMTEDLYEKMGSATYKLIYVGLNPKYKICFAQYIGTVYMMNGVDPIIGYDGDANTVIEYRYPVNWITTWDAITTPATSDPAWLEDAGHQITHLIHYVLNTHGVDEMTGTNTGTPGYYNMYIAEPSLNIEDGATMEMNCAFDGNCDSIFVGLRAGSKYSTDIHQGLVWFTPKTNEVWTINTETGIPESYTLVPAAYHRYRFILKGEYFQFYIDDILQFEFLSTINTATYVALTNPLNAGIYFIMQNQVSYTTKIYIDYIKWGIGYGNDDSLFFPLAKFIDVDEAQDNAILGGFKDAPTAVLITSPISRDDGSIVNLDEGQAYADGVQLQVDTEGEVTGVKCYNGGYIVTQRHHITFISGVDPHYSKKTLKFEDGKETGCVSHWCLKIKDGILYGIGENKAWKWTGEEFLEDASKDQIQDIIDTAYLPDLRYHMATLLEDWNAGFFNHTTASREARAFWGSAYADHNYNTPDSLILSAETLYYSITPPNNGTMTQYYPTGYWLSPIYYVGDKNKIDKNGIGHPGEWGAFEAIYNITGQYGGSVEFYIRSGTSRANCLAAGWTQIIPGETITEDVNNYWVQVKIVLNTESNKCSGTTTSGSGSGHLIDSNAHFITGARPILCGDVVHITTTTGTAFSVYAGSVISDTEIVLYMGGTVSVGVDYYIGDCSKTPLVESIKLPYTRGGKYDDQPISIVHNNQYYTLLKHKFYYPDKYDQPNYDREIRLILDANNQWLIDCEWVYQAGNDRYWPISVYCYFNEQLFGGGKAGEIFIDEVDINKNPTYNDVQGGIYKTGHPLTIIDWIWMSKLDDWGEPDKDKDLRQFRVDRRNEKDIIDFSYSLGENLWETAKQIPITTLIEEHRDWIGYGKFDKFITCKLQQHDTYPSGTNPGEKVEILNLDVDGIVRSRRF